MTKNAGLAIVCPLVAVLLIAGLVGPATPAFALDCPPQLRHIREHIVSLIEEGEVPSIAVGVVHGALRWEEGFGLGGPRSRHLCHRSDVVRSGVGLQAVHCDGTNDSGGAGADLS